MKVNLKGKLNYSGDNEETLQDILKQINEGTYEDEVEPISINIFSVIEYNKNGAIVGKINPEFLFPYGFYDMKRWYFQKPKLGLISNSVFNSRGFEDSDIESLVEAGFFIQYELPYGRRRIVVPSGSFLNSFVRVAGLKNPNPGMDLFRDLYVASRMQDKEDNIKIISRGNGKVNKGIAVFSKNYSCTDSEIYPTVKKELGGSLLWYNITHYKCAIDLRQESCAVNDFQYELGTRLTYSDAGDSSYKLETILINNGGVVVLGGVSHAHDRTFNLSNFIKEFKKEDEKIRKRLNTKLALCAKRKVLSPNDAVGEIINSLKCGNKRSGELKNNYVITEENCTELDVIKMILQIPENYKQENEYIRTKVSVGIGQYLMKGA